MKNLGFTLAEVLITLGIIGVVAALTIPNVTKGYQKRETVTRLQKTYATLTQAVSTAQAEYGDPKDWDYSLTGKAFFDKYFASLKKVSEVQLSTVMPNYQPMQKTLSITDTVFYQKRNNFNVIVLPSGAWVIYDTTSQSKAKQILVDINGKKNPNIIGMDLFYMYFLSNGKIIFYEVNSNDGDILGKTNKTRDQLLNDNLYSCRKYGFWCGALIQADGWEIKKDYPWR